MFLFAPIKWAVKILSLIIFGAVVYLLVTAVQVTLTEQSAPTAPIPNANESAILVLVPEQSLSVPSSDLLGRVQETLTLFQSRISQHIILVSALRQNPITAFEHHTQSTLNPGITAAHKWLLANGVKSADISSSVSSSTFGALKSITSETPPYKHIAVVTDAINRLWMSHLVAAAGLKTDGVYAARESKGLPIHNLASLWSQTTGVAAGRIIGFRHTTWVSG